MVFNPDRDIPDLTGKVILVTGGNIGLGKESILQLAEHNPSQIYLAARSQSKAEAAITEIKSQVPKANITFLEVDLSSFESIKQAARTFVSASSRLDILMNNAGIMAYPPGLTREGYEIQLGTNHLGHALLTKLLLPTLKATAQQPEADVRIVNLSSRSHEWAPKSGYMLDQAKTDMGDISTWTRYGQSKLANIHYTRGLARQLDAEAKTDSHNQIKCCSIHPGSVASNLISGRAGSNAFFAWILVSLFKLFLTTVQKGALNQLWAATSPDAKSGMYYHPVGVAGKENALAKDEALCRELWEWTERELEGHT